MRRRKRSASHRTNTRQPHPPVHPPTQQLTQPNPKHRRKHPHYTPQISLYAPSKTYTNTPCQAPGQLLAFNNSTSKNTHFSGLGKNGKIDREPLEDLKRLINHPRRRAATGTASDIVRESNQSRQDGSYIPSLIKARQQATEGLHYHHPACNRARQLIITRARDLGRRTCLFIV